MTGLSALLATVFDLSMKPGPDASSCHDCVWVFMDCTCKKKKERQQLHVSDPIPPHVHISYEISPVQIYI